MSLSFESLERRDLLTDLDLNFDGPRIVNAGDEVTYTLSVTNITSIAKRTIVSWGNLMAMVA